MPNMENGKSLETHELNIKYCKEFHKILKQDLPKMFSKVFFKMKNSPKHVIKP